MHMMSLNVERKNTSSDRYAVDHYDVFKTSLSNYSPLSFFVVFVFSKLKKSLDFVFEDIEF